jgi:hypothetical protein
MSKTDFELTVSYPWDGHWRDDPIIDAIGEESRSGSGVGFGYRDLNFVYPTQEAAETALKRLQKANVGFEYRWEIGRFDWVGDEVGDYRLVDHGEEIV